MKTAVVTKFAERIRWEYGFTQEISEEKAVRALKICPAVLVQNVEEWSEGKKLTDIYIDQYTLPMILNIWKSRDFLNALGVMAELEKGSRETAELKIWKMRR